MGDRSALIVAIGTYQDPELRQLRAPAQDAAALAEVLATSTIGAFQVQPVVDQPSHQIAHELERFFAGRGREDLLLVHLSCHGVKDDEGRLFFAATNTERHWLASTAVSARFLNELMDGCRARSIVLLLDCCYSGAVLQGSRGIPASSSRSGFRDRGVPS
jgi:molecular chaperone DnaJ